MTFDEQLPGGDAAVDVGVDRSDRGGESGLHEEIAELLLGEVGVSDLLTGNRRGRTLREPIAALERWAVGHMDEVLAARKTYEARRG